jgi:hypothetical protein
MLDLISNEQRSYTFSLSERITRSCSRNSIRMISPSYHPVWENRIAPDSVSTRCRRPLLLPRATAKTEPSSEKARQLLISFAEVFFGPSSSSGFPSGMLRLHFQFLKAFSSLSRTTTPSRFLIVGHQIRQLLSSPTVENCNEFGSAARSKILPAAPGAWSCGSRC